MADNTYRSDGEPLPPSHHQYRTEGEPLPPSHHQYTAMGMDRHDRSDATYPQHHHPHSPQHARGSPYKEGSAGVTPQRGRSAPQPINTPGERGPASPRGSPPKSSGGSPGGKSGSPRRGNGFSPGSPRGGSDASLGRSGRSMNAFREETGSSQSVNSPYQRGRHHPSERDGQLMTRQDSQGRTPELTPSSHSQQFHHPHFHHHRSAHRHSSGKDSLTSSPSLQQSPRSMSVTEHSNLEDASPHRSRHPPKSSHSLDNPSNINSPNSPYRNQSGPQYPATPTSTYQTPSATKRNVAVTDLDQAMQERDESRLRSLFGDHMPSPANKSLGYSPGYSASFGEIDIDETNLDDDPVNVKYVTNINVQNYGNENLTEGAGREEEGYGTLIDLPSLNFITI